MSEDINPIETEEENLIFKGLKFFQSGNLRDGIEESLVKHGGEKIEYFSDYVKICIVGEDPLETDLTDAKEIYEVPAVRQDWVTFSLSSKKQLEPKAFEIDNVLFKDVVLHCTGLGKEDSFTLLSHLFFNGGAFEKDLNSEQITHLVCNAASGVKYEYVFKNRPNIKLVTPDWLLLSLKQKHLLNEAEYHPRLLIVSKPASAPESPKEQQELGDLSSITGFDDVDTPSGSDAAPNLQQLKQRFPWMSPSATRSQSPAAGAQAMSAVMSQLRPPAVTSAHQMLMTQGVQGGLPNQLKLSVSSPAGVPAPATSSESIQQRIYVQQHLSQQQKQLLIQQQQKQQQQLLIQQQKQQQQQGVQLSVQWNRGSHQDGVVQQQQQQQHRQLLQPGQQQIIQQGQIIQRGQQIIQQTSQGQQIIQQSGVQQIIQQTSQGQQIIQTSQGQQIIQQTSQGQQIIQQTSQGQQIIQQTNQGQQIAQQSGGQIIQQNSQGQQIFQQNIQNQQVLQGASGQQLIQQGLGAQQLIQKGPGRQQLIQQGPGGQQLIQGPGGQQLIQQGPGGQQLIQQGPGGQQLIQGPGGQQMIQGPGGQQLIQGMGGQQLMQQGLSGQQLIQQGLSSQQLLQQGLSGQQLIQQGPGGQQSIQSPGSQPSIQGPGGQQLVQGGQQQVQNSGSGRIIAEQVISQGRVIQEQVIQQGRVQLPPDQIIAQGRVIQQDPQGTGGTPIQMQQIIFRGRDGQQHILQQPYQPGAPGSNQAGPQQQWPFRQAGPPASPGPQIVIQQQNQQHVLQQQQQNQQQQILLQQQLNQQQGQPGQQQQQIFIQQAGGNQQRSTNWTLVQQHQIPPRGQVLKLNARAHQQLQNMTPQEKSNFLNRLHQRHIIMQMQQGQRPGGAIIRNVGPGQQIATVIRHPTTGNWVHAQTGQQMNPQQQHQQQQQQIILQQQSGAAQQGQGQQVRVQAGGAQHLLQHKPGAATPGGQGFAWNGGTGAQPVETGPGPAGVVQQAGPGQPVSMELLQLKQRQQMAKLLQQQQQLAQQQAKPSTTPLYNQVMEQTQAANQSLTTPDLISSSDLNEVSAAGQLRLMTAHHQAQLAPHASSATQHYQSAQPNGGIPSGPPGVLSQQPLLASPQRSGQTIVTSSRSHGTGHSASHSAAQRVAAVLAKSAAGQSVSAQHQQQMQHQQRAQFYGHNPNIKLPPEKCLLGCVFLIVEYDKQPEVADQVEVWKNIIIQNGGEVETSYVLRLTHILCLSQKHPLVHQGLRDGKRCITANWLNDVITRQHVLPPHLAIHFPTPFSDEKPCRSHYICSTGFEKEERDRVRWMIEAIGAKYCSYYHSRIDFLVAKKLEGDKVKKAKELQRPIVNVQWLNEVMFGHYACIQQHDSQKYQQFNLSHPFRIDYSLVLHLMGPWKVPINVSQEAYERAKAVGGSLVGPRRKKPRLSHPSDELDDIENSDLPGLTLDPLPYENKPRILLSSFAKPQVEEKIIKQLGAEVATSWRDATHLVLGSPDVGRTFKFLCAVSRVRYIVSAAWLRASLQACHLLDEPQYMVQSITATEQDIKNESEKTEYDNKPSVQLRVICDIPAVLARGEERARLFQGKVFYLSPSISPSPSALREMIEAAGGAVERQRRSWSKIPQDCMITGSFVPERCIYYVITCQKDFNLVADLIKHDYGIFNTEFVMTSIMTQKLDFSFVCRRADLERQQG